MNKIADQKRSFGRVSSRVVKICGVMLLFGPVGAENFAELVEKERVVESTPNPIDPFLTAPVGKKLSDLEFVRSGEKSRGLLRFPGERGVRLAENTRLRVFPSFSDGDIFALQKGEIYLHSRGKWDGTRVRVGDTVVEPKGTQFLVRAEEGGGVFVVMLEGTAAVANKLGRVEMEPNDRVVVEPGRAPRKLPKIDARNTVQWCLYYPGVLHLPELDFTASDRRGLAASMKAYGEGDLRTALSAWPAGFRARSNAAKVFRAMVVLSVGDVDEARAALASVADGTKGKQAIVEMMDAVTYLPPKEELGVNLEMSGVLSVKGGQDAAEGSDRWTLGVAWEAAGGMAAGPRTASGWLARSYWEQSRSVPGSLQRALAAAEEARRLQPEFGYAVVRVAELQFSMGRIREAQTALAVGMELSPRNAQAWALDGFVLSGQNRISEAQARFEDAIQIDSGLGNAWLGRGLCLIRRGQMEEGRQDLHTAMMLEPNRSFLHSYHGKAVSQSGRAEAGLKDLEFAKQLDPNDPTPWIYSAIIKQEQNRPNEAIRDLNESIARNDNRRLYRSRFLLDQDRAVQSANLASIYQYNGMNQVAVREATRAVESDYTNPAAHLFLANSFDALRDPTRIELRYETPWFHELLVANLLSPVGGGRLSQFVSQQEYSKLLESDGMGVSLHNEWRSDSELRSTASVFGTHGRAGYGLDVHYRDADGDRANADDERLEIYGQFKYEVTPDDTLYLLGKWQDQEGGDTFKTYDNQPLAPGLRFEESQEPGLLLAGWNHRWGPGSNTLFLGGRLSADQTLSDPRAHQLLVQRTTEGLPGNLAALQAGMPPGVSVGPFPDLELTFSPALLDAMAPVIGSGTPVAVNTAPFEFLTKRKWELYTAELQHIQQFDSNTFLAGARFQTGEFETETELKLIRPNFTGFFPTPAAKQRSTTDFERLSVYAYDYWSVAPWLTLIGGVSWDRIDHPDNFRNPPVNDDQREDEQVSAKLGFSLTPSPRFSMRGVYAEALGGITFDESVTLEPVQLAGFNQAYRTVLSESLAGSVETPEFTIMGLSFDGMLPSETWWGLSFNFIEQDVDRTIGAFSGYDVPLWPATPAYFPDDTAQALHYEEFSIEATVNQLIGNEFAIGALYRFTESELHSRLPEFTEATYAFADLTDEARLHEVSLFGNWNSPSGLFGRVEANWYSQDLDDDPARGAVSRSGDEFWQLNAFMGYRFSDNQGEISVGLLNINDAGYNLSPLNPYGDLPPDRTAVVRCRVTF